MNYTPRSLRTSRNVLGLRATMGRPLAILAAYASFVFAGLTCGPVSAQNGSAQIVFYNVPNWYAQGHNNIRYPDPTSAFEVEWTTVPGIFQCGRPDLYWPHTPATISWDLHEILHEPVPPHSFGTFYVATAYQRVCATGELFGPWEVTGVARRYAGCQDSSHFGYDADPNGCPINLTLPDYNKDRGPPDCRDQCFGDPINAGLGNKFETHVEYRGPGEFPLEFAWTYNSTGHSGTATPYDLFLGRNRSHTFLRRVSMYSSGTLSTAYLSRPDGDSLRFQKSGTNWLGEPDQLGTLAATTDAGGEITSWVYEESDGGLEAYDASGRLEWIEDGKGRRQTMHYDSVGRLDRVIDAHGRSLKFNYLGTRLESLALPDGNSVQFEFSGDDLYRIEYADGTTKRYFHDESGLAPNLQRGLMTGVEDERGNRYSSTKYVSVGPYVVATETWLANLAPHIATYQIGGGGYSAITSVQTPLGATETSEYIVSQSIVRLTSKVTTCTNCPTDTLGYAYTNRGQVDIATRNGLTTDFDYDSRGLEIERVEAKSLGANTNLPEKRTTETTWHPVFRAPAERRVKNASGALVGKTGWTYNSRSQLETIAQTDPVTTATRTTTYAYCKEDDVSEKDTCPILGLLKSVDGPRTDATDVTVYAYRSEDHEDCATLPTTCAYRQGDLWKVTNALGHVTETLAYDGAGRVLSSKDPNGLVTDFSYHPRGWLTHRKVRGPNNAVETDDAITAITYWPTGLVKRVMQPDGDFLFYEYDSAHRLTAIEDALGNRIDYTLDNAGNRTAEVTKDSTSAIKRQLSRVYDQLGRLEEEQNAALQTVATHGYDDDGNLTSTEDALGIETRQEYDPLDRLKETIQDYAGLGVETKFEYDALDRLTKVTDPKSLDTDYTYNGFGDLTQLDSPDTGITAYTDYDGAGNRLTQTDARGITATHAYDVLNRLTAITYPTASQNVAYFYDQNNGVTGCAASFFVGRLTRFTDATGSTTYCYDRRGNVTHKTQVTPDGLTLVLTYEYTLGDRLASLTYPSGRKLLYGRDGVGRIATLGEFAGVGQPTAPIVSQVTYLPFGPLTGLQFSNGTALSLTYDADYTIDTVGGDALQLDFTVDLTGNITAIDGPTAAQDRVFEYDPLSRLTLVENGSSNFLEAFAYDGTGNRLVKSRPIAGPWATSTYVYGSNNHRLEGLQNTLGGVTVRRYDSIGSLIDRGDGLELDYDDRQRLSVGHVGGIDKQYNSYSARGERLVKSETNTLGNPINNHYLYDEGGRLLAEYQGVGITTPTLRREYVWLDDRPVAVIAASGAYSGLRLDIHTDHLGTPRAIKRPKAVLAPVWRWNLDGSAFGDHAPLEDPDGDGTSFVFNLRYPGQYFDHETGLHYNYFRDYEAGTGRYIESDPIGLSGGMSTYAYAGGSPLDEADPLGLFPGYGGAPFLTCGRTPYGVGCNFPPPPPPLPTCKQKCNLFVGLICGPVASAVTGGGDLIEWGMAYSGCRAAVLGGCLGFCEPECP